MATRARGILVDSTLGKMFTNTSSVQSADSSKLIAGTKLQSTVIYSPKKKNIVVVNQLGSSGRGKVFPTGALLTKITASVLVAPIGSDIIIGVKVGQTYDTSSPVSFLTIAENTKSTTNSVSISISPDSALFFDVIQVGSIKPGQSLAITFSYYVG